MGSQLLPSPGQGAHVGIRRWLKQEGPGDSKVFFGCLAGHSTAQPLSISLPLLPACLAPFPRRPLVVFQAQSHLF